MDHETSTISGINYPVTFVYTPGGKVSSVTYPSGRIVTNTRNALGKISTVNATGIGDLVSNLSYKPFGGPKGLTNGFGGTVNNVAGECDCLTISNPGQPRERTYGYDANRNLTSIPGTNTPWYSQTFEYDQLNRLTSATGRYGTISYTYDDVGNRLTRDTNGTVETYTYVTGTNRLQAVTGGQNSRTFAYDSNGNITGDGTLNFIYDQNNQLIEVEQGANSIAEYAYNGLGQRVIKQAGANTTVYHYDLDGKLIAESLLDGTTTREYLYMGKVRIAMVDVAGGNALYHYLNDRLGTPEILTDASGVVRWEAWYEPFGEAHIHPSSNVVNNIRLPGQYFDSETGFHYNYHRYYDPKTGRYLTPDPIGLEGGINLFAYVGNDAVNRIDPLGLAEVRRWEIGGYEIKKIPGDVHHGGPHYHIEKRGRLVGRVDLEGKIVDEGKVPKKLLKKMKGRGLIRSLGVLGAFLTAKSIYDVTTATKAEAFENLLEQISDLPEDFQEDLLKDVFQKNPDLFTVQESSEPEPSSSTNPCE
jgi:RHS repeat-associated protein